LALDIPGCGKKRARPAENICLSQVASELIAEVRQAGIEDAVLVGHSMAGVVMPYLADQAPGLFSHLIFVTACVPRLGESVMQTMGSGLRGLDPAVVGYPVDPATTDPFELMRAMFAPGLSDEDVQWLLQECSQDSWPMSLAVEPLAVDLCNIRVPKSYIVTAADPILPPAWQGRFAERAGAANQLTLDAAHEVFLSHPVALADALLRATDQAQAMQ
tara:strand:+ start:81925 stop:82575 length:651 start_codon:yes stop_codon:yes gene_type:complete